MATSEATLRPLPAADCSRWRGRELATSQAYYRNFDYLRLFLAVEVVAGHLWAGLMRPGNFWIPLPAVATFIALSGFLIPQSVERSRSLSHFAWKRALRTLPALFVVFVAIAIEFSGKRCGGAILQYLTAGYRGEFLGVTLPFWSLMVEDGLYALLALLFVFKLHQRAWLTLPVIVGLMIGASFITGEMNRYRLFDTSIAFFTGNLICIYHDRLRRLHWLVPAAVVAASLMGWLDVMGRIAFPVQIAAVLVLAMTLPQIRFQIPDLSYGIYIWHAPIMMALLWKYGMERAMPWVITTSVVTLIAALLSWYLVEERALRLKNYRWTRWRILAPTASRLETAQASNQRKVA